MSEALTQEEVQEELEMAISYGTNVSARDAAAYRVKASHEVLRMHVDMLRLALAPFERLDFDIGDEWREDCERARKALKETL